MFTQYIDTNKAQEKNNTKLGAISLYNDPGFYLSEQQVIVEYAKLLEYQDNRERELLQNACVDDNGNRVDSNGLLFEELIHREQYTTNAINKLFKLGIEKIENKKFLNKGVQLAISQSMLDSYGPAFALDIKQQQEAIDSKQDRVKEIKHQVEVNKKNKNQSRNKKLLQDFLNSL